MIEFLAEQGLKMPRDNASIVGALFEFKEEAFYEITSIRLEKSKVFKFMGEQYPLHFFRSKKECYQKGANPYFIESTLKIRCKLEELKVPYDLCKQIEDLIMQNRLQEIFRVCIEESTRRHIVEFVRRTESILAYLDIKFMKRNYREQASSKVMELLMACPSINNLTFQEMKTIAEKYSQNLEIPLGILNVMHQKTVKAALESDPFLVEYRRKGKIDMAEERLKALEELFFIFNGVPGCLSCSDISQLSESFVKENNIRAFIESDCLTKQQKDYLESQVSRSKVLEEYSKVFKRSQECESLFQISNMFSEKAYCQAFVNYCSLFGEIKVDAQGNLLLNECQEKRTLTSMGAERINRVQGTREFENFKRHFLGIFKAKEETLMSQLEEKLNLAAMEMNLDSGEMIFESMKSCEFDTQVLREEQNPLIDRMLQDITFKELERLLMAKKINSAFMEEQNMRNYIEELRNMPELRRYTVEEKDEFMGELKSDISRLLENINGLDILSKEKQSLAERVRGSQEYQRFIAAKSATQPAQSGQSV